MGGLGSGRRGPRSAAGLTCDHLAIDVRAWQRADLFTPGQEFAWRWAYRGRVVASTRVHVEEARVILQHQVQSGGELRSMHYAVALDWTPCHLGGERPWFHCPSCGRRVAILYGAEHFACRHCLRLVYASQREPAHDRALRRAEKIRERLGWMPGILNRPGDKPKGACTCAPSCGW